MNQIATAPLGKNVTMTSGDGGFAVTPQTLSDVVEFAHFMCKSNAGIPSYLRNNAPDCGAIIMQALKWGFDPFSVAQKSYKVKDVLAYEAQLIAAVINARSGIKGRLKYHFEGTGDELVCTVSGTLDGEECVYTSPRVGNITTKNSPLWKTDPQQQLGYYSARNWARRHCPEVILGVYDRDEAEEFRGPDRAKNITPAFDPLSDDVQEPSKSTERNDWLSDVDDADAETVAERDEEDQQTDEDNAASSSQEAGDTPPASASEPSTGRDILIRYAKDVLPKAADPNVAPSTLAAIEKRWATELSKLAPGDKEKARAIAESMRAVLNGKNLDIVLDHYADVLECTVEALGG
jgi:hypothetical protein